MEKENRGSEQQEVPDISIRIVANITSPALRQRPIPDIEVAAMYLALDTYIPLIIESNSEKRPISEYHHSLSNIPRFIDAVCDEDPKSVEDLKKFWKGLKAAHRTAHEKFLNLAGIILKCLDSDVNKKKLFNSFVKRTANPDLDYFIEHLKLGTANTISMSQKAPYTSDYRVCRVIRMKKDLVECLISTFDTLCFHRNIFTGFEVCEPEVLLPTTSLRRFSSSSSNIRWLGAYKKRCDEDLEVDQPFTKSTILQSSINNLLSITNVRARKTQNNKIEEYTDFHKSLKENFSLDLAGKLSPNNLPMFCFPLFRMLLDTFGQQENPTLYEFAEGGACRILSSCRNTVIGGGSKLINQGPTQVKSCFQKIHTNKSVFCTKVGVKVELKASSAEPTRPSMEEEIIYELINRESKQVKLISAAPVHECLRASPVPNIYDVNLDLAKIMETDPQRGCTLIDDFFDNNNFYNVDPSLTFYKLHQLDRFEVNLEWHGIEGDPFDIASYLIVTYLKSSMETGYQKQASYLLHQAVNDKNRTARDIIDNFFPDMHEKLKAADAEQKAAIYQAIESEN